MRRAILSTAALTLWMESAAFGQTAGGGDPVAGKQVFQQCVKCHSLGETDASSGRGGPPLDGVLGRRSGSYAGYAFSPQLRSARMVWDVPNLARFLARPKTVIPGTQMLFNGLADPSDIANVIAYIAQFGEAKPVPP